LAATAEHEINPINYCNLVNYKVATWQNMKTVFVFLCLYLSTIDDGFSQFEKQIPIKWKISQQIDGDFNDDKIKDIFVMIDSMDAKNTWVCIKRILLIFHGTVKGFVLVDTNTLIFADRNNRVDSDMVYLKANQNIVRMGIGDMNVNGYNGSIGYTFRFQNKKWYAIGCSSTFDRLVTDEQNNQVMRIEDFNYNFITGKYERITKTDSKMVSKTEKRKSLNQQLFREYNGVCDETLR
jgi:hypothetical protein